MKKLILVAAHLLLGLAWQPSFGQAPWVTITGFSDGNYTYTPCLSAPTADAVWGLSTSYQMRSIVGSSVFATANKGQTWQFSTSLAYALSGTGSSAVDLSAVDGQTAWLLRYNTTSYNPTSNPTLLYTSTGPMDFTTLVSVLPDAFQKIHFFTKTTGVAVTNRAAGATTWPVYRTTDGGATWTLVAGVSAAAGSTTESISAKYNLGNSLWLTTSTGTVLGTADAGLTWTATPSLGKVAFEDAQHGLAYGNYLAAGGQTLSRTSDGGVTWTKVAFSGEPLFRDMTAVPGQPGTYVSVGSILLPNSYYGYRGRTAVSHDYGSTWQVELTSNVDLEHIAAASASQVWASATNEAGAYTLQTQLMRYVGTALPTKNAAAASLVVAYPNPTTGVLQLAGPLPGGAEVRVYDAAGRLCQTAQVSEARPTLDLSAQAPGLYQLVVTAGTGAVSSQRISRTQ